MSRSNVRRDVVVGRCGRRGLAGRGRV